MAAAGGDSRQHARRTIGPSNTGGWSVYLSPIPFHSRIDTETKTATYDNLLYKLCEHTSCGPLDIILVAHYMHLVKPCTRMSANSILVELYNRELSRWEIIAIVAFASHLTLLLEERGPDFVGRDLVYCSLCCLNDW